MAWKWMTLYSANPDALMLGPCPETYDGSSVMQIGGTGLIPEMAGVAAAAVLHNAKCNLANTELYPTGTRLTYIGQGNDGAIQIYVTDLAGVRTVNYWVYDSNLNQVASVSFSFTLAYYPIVNISMVVDEDNGTAYIGHTTFNRNVDTHTAVCSYFVKNDLNLWQYFRYSIPTETPHPYGPGGYSQPSEPHPTYDDEDEPVTIPTAPSIMLSNNGFIRVWAPTNTELNDFANYLWGNFDKTDASKVLSKVFTTPIDAVLSLHMLPFTPSTSTAIEVTVGSFATGVNMKPCAEQFHDVDCGSITFSEYWSNYLDYNPGTRLVLCLPFVGQVDLDPDEVMGETVSVLYRCDVVTGTFVCFVKTATKVLGQYAGNCALNVPVTAANYAQLNAAIIQSCATVAGIAGGAAVGGMTAAVGGAAAAEAGASDLLNASSSLYNSAQNVQNNKMRIQHSGGLSGAPGFMGVQQPYVIIHRARQSVPEDSNKFQGFPSNITETLNSLSGFTVIKNIDLSGVPFTEDEINELRGILRGGIHIS